MNAGHPPRPPTRFAMGLLVFTCAMLAIMVGVLLEYAMPDPVIVKARCQISGLALVEMQPHVFQGQGFIEVRR